MVGAQLHGGVDALSGGNAGVQNVSSLVDHGNQDLVDDEAGSLVDLDGLLADGHGAVPNGLEGLVGGVGAADDLNQLHDGGGVEEVHADEAVSALGGGGDGGDGDGGGVGGQNGLGLADLVQLSEDGLLDLQILDGGLNDQIGVSSQAQIGGEGHLVGDGLLAGLVQLALGNQLVQTLVQTGLGSLDDLVLNVADDDLKALLGESLSDIQTHGAAADNNNFVHLNYPLNNFEWNVMRDMARR